MYIYKYIHIYACVYIHIYMYICIYEPKNTNLCEHTGGDESKDDIGYEVDDFCDVLEFGHNHCQDLTQTCCHLCFPYIIHIYQLLCIYMLHVYII